MGRAIFATRNESQPIVGPLYGIDSVTVRLRLQNTLRPILRGHVIHAHMMIGRAGRHKCATGRERCVNHLCPGARTDSFEVLCRLWSAVNRNEKKKQSKSQSHAPHNPLHPPTAIWQHSLELGPLSARYRVLPKRHRTVRAGRHQILHLRLGRRTEIDRCDHASVAGKHGYRCTRL